MELISEETNFIEQTEEKYKEKLLVGLRVEAGHWIQGKGRIEVYK